jgi:hypothetical protein
VLASREPMARIVLWSPGRPLWMNLAVSLAIGAIALRLFDPPSPAIGPEEIEGMRSRARFELIHGWSTELGIEPGKTSPGALEELSRRMPATQAVDVRVEGIRYFGRGTMVRARVTVGGAPPPGGSCVRYFHVFRPLFSSEPNAVVPSSSVRYRSRPW